MSKGCSCITSFLFFFVSFGYVVHARYIVVYLAVLSAQTMDLFLLLFCVKSHFFFIHLLSAGACALYGSSEVKR